MIEYKKFIYLDVCKTGSTHIHFLLKKIIKDKPVRAQDLGATIYHALGVPLDLRLGKDGFTRPISSGEPIMELFG